MAPSFILSALGLLAIVFPDVQLPTEAEINTTWNTITLVVSLCGVMWRQVRTKRSTWFGSRPQEFEC